MVLNNIFSKYPAYACQADMPFVTKKDVPYRGKKHTNNIKKGITKNNKEYLLKIVFFSNFNKIAANKKKTQVIGIYQVGKLWTSPVVKNIQI